MVAAAVVVVVAVALVVTAVTATVASPSTVVVATAPSVYAAPTASAPAASVSCHGLPSALADAQPGEQKQMLGELLLPAVSATHPVLAYAIAGLLLELENDIVRAFLDFRQQLDNKNVEAVGAVGTLAQAE